MRRPRRLCFVVALGAAVGVLAGVVVADAAQVSMSGGQISTVESGHPCPGTTSAEPTSRRNGNNYWAVTLTFPSGCANRPVQLVLNATGTGNDRSGAATTDAAGRATITFSSYYSTNTDYSLLSTADGWAMSVTDWASELAPHIWCSVPDDATATCDATVTLFRGTKPGGGEFDYYDVVVTTTSTTYVTWEVGMKLDHTFYGPVPNTLGNSTLDGYWDGATNWTGAGADVTRVSACNQYPGVLLLTGVGTTGSNPFAGVKADRVRSFSLVLNYQQGTYDDLVTAACSP